MNESAEGRDGYLLANGRRIYHVYKQDFPMEFWYGLTPDANREDCAGLIDVRTLPKRYQVRPLKIDIWKLPRRSWNKAMRAQLYAHALAFAEALVDGYDLEAHAREQDEISAREWAPRTQVTDDDCPF